MIEYLPIAAILVLLIYLGVKKGTKGQLLLLGVIAATWLFIGLAGEWLANTILGQTPGSGSLLRNGLGGEVPETGLTPQPNLLPSQEVKIFNTLLFIGIVGLAGFLIWRFLPEAMGFGKKIAGGILGAVNALLISLFLFRLNEVPIAAQASEEGVSALRLQSPGETTPSGLPLIVVLAILVIIFLAVRALQRPQHGPLVGPYES